MFDTDASASIYRGGMIRNKNIADRNADLAERNDENARQWMERSQAFEAELAKTKAELAKTKALLDGKSISEKALVKSKLQSETDLKAELRKTKTLLETAEMSIAGYSAVSKAFMEALKVIDLNHSLIAYLGLRYYDRRPKYRINLIYDQAFDAKGIELRIANPESRRGN
jgi:uncharacterized protein (DUF1684 family)